MFYIPDTIATAAGLLMNFAEAQNFYQNSFCENQRVNTAADATD
jgi:hypothetical protein